MERFPDEYVTWNHNTPVGIKVNEVFGMDSKAGKPWLILAKQIYCEQGQNYRVLDHFPNGAPFLEGIHARISMTHTDHFLAVALLPKTPDVDLAVFNPRSAMGIDAEKKDRMQVLKIRDKFLSDNEQSCIDKDNIEKNILAWTSKEAVYKAGMTPGIDFRNKIQIMELPVVDPAPEKMNQPILGEATLYFPDHMDLEPQILKLFAYESYDCIVTIAFSPKCAKFNSSIL